LYNFLNSECAYRNKKQYAMGTMNHRLHFSHVRVQMRFSIVKRSPARSIVYQKSGISQSLALQSQTTYVHDH